LLDDRFADGRGRPSSRAGSRDPGRDASAHHRVSFLPTPASAYSRTQSSSSPNRLITMGERRNASTILVLPVK